MPGSASVSGCGTPPRDLYRAEYPTGLEVPVVLLGSTSADAAALALLRQRCRDAIQIQHPNVLRSMS